MIRSPKVRLISETGEQIGVVAVEEAWARAEAAQLDLVEVAAEADPPVCRIYDYKKVIYEQKRRQKESRKKAHVTELKEIKMRVTIDGHDRDFKLRHAREFLEIGDKVKFTIQYRGREITKPELGDKLIAAITENLKDIGEPEGMLSRQGKQHTLIFVRRKDWKPTVKAAGAAPVSVKNTPVIVTPKT